MGLDQDDIVLAPWTTIKYRLKGGRGATEQGAASGPSAAGSIGGLYPVLSTSTTELPPALVSVDQILAKAASAEQIPEATDQITELLRQRHRIHPGQDDDFNIRDMTALMKAITPRWW